MPIVVPREMADSIEEETLRKMELRHLVRNKKALDVVTWGESQFYLPQTGKPIIFEPFQKVVLLLSFTRGEDGHFPFSLVVYSTVKKSGKTTLAAVVGRWFAEEQTHFGEVYTMGNDMRQSRERSFEAIKQSIQATPGYRHKGAEGVLPDRWLAQTYRLDCLTSGTKIEAVSVDAAGEAGSNQDLTIWTELWGFESREAIKFFNEMTPVPTKDSVRLVETYAGFDGESDLLRGIYDDGMEHGRQMTAGEAAERTGIPLGAFEESSNADDLIPIWINEERGLFMYWDSGPQARRMPWQKGERGAKYYREQESTLPPPQNTRLHSNLWVGGEGEFIPMTSWDNCYDPDLEPLKGHDENGQGGDRIPAVLSVDAATTADCFGAVLLTRNPKDSRMPAIRHARKWDPPKGGRIDYDEPEAWILECAEKYNILEICYDPFQLEQMMRRLYKLGINTKPFDQGTARLIADSNFYRTIIRLGLVHRNNLDLREHVRNSGSRIMSKDEDSKMRIVKRVEHRKIDLCVAASMGVNRILYYNL
jgi:phage terminase large subunit-like protein